jgi:rhodanese-related sulfurtransferase
MIMKTTKMWLLALIFLAFAAVSCDNEEDPVDEAKLLVEYLESGDGGNYANTAMAAIKSAEATRTGNIAGTVYLVDIRAAADFAAGHVENAVNVAAADLLTHLDGTDADDGKDVILICYSGQTAAWATCLLRLAGYDNAYSMLYGMCSWNTDFAGSWNSNVSNTWAASFEDDAVAKGPAGDLPVLNTGKTTGEEIMKVRVAEVLAEGFGAAAVGNAEVFGALDNYYVVNYWAEADYTKYGHIPGASQYTPKASIALDADLLTLPTDKPVVVYCWTGQTSANMAAYLKVIGYDAKSLKFGANGMIYDELEGHKWSEAAIMDYTYVTD